MTIKRFESDDTIFLTQMKDILKQKNVMKTQMEYIFNNFRQISFIIKKFESNEPNIIKNFKLIEDLRNKLREDSSCFGTLIYKRLEEILCKNPGFEHLRQMSYLIENNLHLSTEKYTFEQIFNFKNTFVSNASVERSFSRYRHILSDRRTNFSQESLKTYLFSNINSNSVNEM